MKVASFKETEKHGIKIFKPIQYLNVRGTSEDADLDSCKMRVRIVSSETGRVDEIIPNVSLGILGEITSMNEGFFIFDESTGSFSVNVMLHPTSAIYLSNDKYLEVDITGLSSVNTCSIYGLEMPVIDKDFVCRYSKFYMAAGELQKTFNVGGNENLVLPAGTFEEITLHYKNGVSCSYVVEELLALMNLKNDVVYMYDNQVHPDDFAQDRSIVFGSWFMCGLDVSDVETLTIRRSAGESSYEFILMDTMKD